MAAHIRSAVFTGRLVGDERISQDAIAEELGVSRVPVREALIALERDGLVASEPHRGTYVIPILEEDIEDHYRMYGMIQGMAAGRAVDHLTEEALGRLQQLHDEMSRTEDPSRLHGLDSEFHRMIIRSGASKRVRSVLLHLSNKLAQEVFLLPAGTNPDANAEHARILDALRRGDATEVDRASQDHLQHEGRIVVAALRKAGVLAGDGDVAPVQRPSPDVAAG